MTIAYGMRANEQAISTLVANVAVLAATTYSASDPNAQASYQALTQSVAANLDGQPGTQTDHRHRGRSRQCSDDRRQCDAR